MILPNNQQFTPDRALTVEIVTFPDVQLLDVAGPMQVFASANALLASKGRPEHYKIQVVSPRKYVRATAGLQFETLPMCNATPIDTLIVAGGQGVLRAADDPMMIHQIQSRAAMSRRVASVCTGVFLLAATGLLNGRRVATHWKWCDRLAQKHPLVEVDPEPIFIQDGHIFTSAGVTAGIDLSLAFVEEDVGRAVALDVARDLVVFLKRPGGQAQFSAALDFQSSNDQFAGLHQWIVSNLVEPLTLAQLAAYVGMSERSFQRHYYRATGFTPAKSVERLRVDAARRLLIDSLLPLKRIAKQCGFGSEETMRRAFVRHQKILPQDFRARFGSAMNNVI